ncbi:MAG: TM2 domain protein [bacterium ADurb.Bin425]|nr:MAG: TM2 domain protein [bacterium ADurb.Bin425]
MTDKDPAVACLLCLFLGVFGAHRFYLGKTGSAVAQLLTFGGLGIWMTIDLFMLAFGTFKDGQGNVVPGGNRKGTALLLLYLPSIFGLCGMHRFYVKRYGSGVAQLLTLGGLGIWQFIDAIMLCTNQFVDKDGVKVLE